MQIFQMFKHCCVLVMIKDQLIHLILQEKAKF